MISTRSLSKALVFVLVAVILLIAASMIYDPGPQPQQEIPAEVLECDYCTFNYRIPFTLGYTHQQPDGNRLVEGQSDLPNASYAEVDLGETPSWIVASPMGNESIWVAVSDDGNVSAFSLMDGVLEQTNITPNRIHADSPPLLTVKGGEAFLVASGASNESLLTHPIVLTNSGKNVFIDTGNDLVFRVNEEEAARFEVEALPDARLVTDENERILLLTGATTDYGHGVLGDEIEASNITIVENTRNTAIVNVIELPSDDVAEGIAPIWADLDGDGIREIIVTLSNKDEGARLVVFNENGDILASGSAVGQGYRWRHQIAVAPFGPEGEMEIAAVLTPHIGGVVEFYELEGNRLQVVASIPGYTSHQIGSRNLDMAVAGDFDGDGNIELLLPSQDFESLGAIRHTEEGAEVVWQLSPGGKLSTNLAGVQLRDGSIAVGAGTEDGKLRVWY
ncbi:hypothetical protein V7O62_10695 [Methanolobus sp. ZRKC2]|uniref:hypothetical protein n=1 Tax=Methanolobus sp. ZRKC2 TaxID=3125783 RepID=UPI00324967AA